MVDAAMLGLIAGLKFSISLGIFIYSGLVIELLNMKEIRPIYLTGVALIVSSVIELINIFGKINGETIIADDITKSISDIMLLIAGVGLLAFMYLINKNLQKYK